MGALELTYLSTISFSISIVVGNNVHTYTQQILHYYNDANTLEQIENKRQKLKVKTADRACHRILSCLVPSERNFVVHRLASFPQAAWREQLSPVV